MRLMAKGFLQKRHIFSVHLNSEPWTQKTRFRSSNLCMNNCTVSKHILVKGVKTQVQLMTFKVMQQPYN